MGWGSCRAVSGRVGLVSPVGLVGALPTAGLAGAFGAEVHPEGEDPLFEGRLGVSEDGEVHEVDLGLLSEALALGPLEGRQPPVSDSRSPLAKTADHGPRIERLG